MKKDYFKNCSSLEEVKKLYKELALKYHPDRGGDTATMQQINLEYESICKNPAFEFAKQTAQDQHDFLKYPEIINQIIRFQGVFIELIGNWIWLSGNTYPYRKEIKELGFYFAPKKLMWYYRPPDYKSSNKKPQSIEEIRLKYGSDVIDSKRKPKGLAF